MLKSSKKEVSVGQGASTDVASTAITGGEKNSHANQDQEARPSEKIDTPSPGVHTAENAEPGQSTPRNDDIASLQRLRPEWWSTCKGDAPDAAIGACSRLIDAGGIQDSALAEALEKLALAQRRKGRIDDAIASFTKSISVAESTDAYNERGTAYFLKGQVNDAITDYDRAVALDPKNGEAFNNRAWANYKLGHMSEAKIDADKAERLAPDKADVWDTRGHITEALGDRAEAVKSFEKALSLDATLQSSEAGLKRLGAR